MCLYTQVLGRFQTITAPNTVTIAAMGAEFKGARSGEDPWYTSQTCLPCPGCLNNILHPCLHHQLTWCTFSRSCRSFLLWQQCGITQILIAQHHCEPLPLPSPLPLSVGPVLHPPHGTTTAPKMGLGNSAGLKITFSFAELFLTRISSPIRVSMLLHK